MLAAALATTGCGGATPSATDVYHDPSLRRGVTEADGAERELLSRLDAIPPGEPVSIEGQTFVAADPYFAASGRACRAVLRAGVARLACRTDEAHWVFVPEVLGGANPFALDAAGSEP